MLYLIETLYIGWKVGGGGGVVKKNFVYILSVHIFIIFSSGPNRSMTPNKADFNDYLKKNASEKTLPINKSTNDNNNEPLQVIL